MKCVVQILLNEAQSEKSKLHFSRNLSSFGLLTEFVEEIVAIKEKKLTKICFCTMM
jgi:hypothetical protein